MNPIAGAAVVPDGMLVRNFPFKIVQTSDVVALLYEEFNHYRQIFTEGRGFPPRNDTPWSVTLPFELYPDAELIESICENEKDREHMVGK